MLFHFIGLLIVGLIIGAVAEFLVPGNDPGGCLVTSLLGICGSLVGTYLGHVVGLYQFGQPAGFIGSVIGAMVILLLYRLIARRRRF